MGRDISYAILSLPIDGMYISGGLVLGLNGSDTRLEDRGDWRRSEIIHD